MDRDYLNGLEASAHIYIYSMSQLHHPLQDMAGYQGEEISKQWKQLRRARSELRIGDGFEFLGSRHVKEFGLGRKLVSRVNYATFLHEMVVQELDLARCKAGLRVLAWLFVGDHKQLTGRIRIIFLHLIAVILALQAQAARSASSSITKEDIVSLCSTATIPLLRKLAHTDVTPVTDLAFFVANDSKALRSLYSNTLQKIIGETTRREKLLAPVAVAALAKKQIQKRDKEMSRLSKLHREGKSGFTIIDKTYDGLDWLSLPPQHQHADNEEEDVEVEKGVAQEDEKDHDHEEDDEVDKSTTQPDPQQNEQDEFWNGTDDGYQDEDMSLASGPSAPATTAPTKTFPSSSSSKQSSGRPRSLRTTLSKTSSSSSSLNGRLDSVVISTKPSISSPSKPSSDRHQIPVSAAAQTDSSSLSNAATEVSARVTKASPMKTKRTKIESDPDYVEIDKNLSRTPLRKLKRRLAEDDDDYEDGNIIDPAESRPSSTVARAGTANSSRGTAAREASREAAWDTNGDGSAAAQAPRARKRTKHWTDREVARLLELVEMFKYKESEMHIGKRTRTIKWARLKAYDEDHGNVLAARTQVQLKDKHREQTDNGEHSRRIQELNRNRKKAAVTTAVGGTEMDRSE